MRTSLVLALLSVTTLAACQSTTPSSSEGNVPPTTLSTSSAMAAGDVFASIQVWAPALTWSAVTAGTTDAVIDIDAEHSIPAGALQARFVTATIPAAQFNAIFMAAASRQALTQSLAAQGWTADTSVDADGATGTAWGYRRVGSNGVTFLRISANGTKCSSASGRPTECTEYVAKVSQTDALNEGDDL
jgi:hypothetical protein